MDRRDFLLKGTSFLVGGLFGLNSFSKALAFGEQKNSSFCKPRIALIIDDIGFSFSRTRLFLDLKVPITFSILPRLVHSRDLAYEIHGKGHEVMLHQPMEPLNPGIDPGPGALYVGYGAMRIANIMEENIWTVPFAAGVNNHMGSKFTACCKEIKDALKAAREKDLFFIDSLTSSRSMGYKTARGLHMPTASRNIFLDNVPHESEILVQLAKLKRHAQQYGRAIGIGHPFPETAAAVGRFLENIKDSGITPVHVSKILKRA
ncbi:MAG: divergent polysaccharide deacetylase family protein [Deltaproteobacteria bacterium]|nr:divergent polysaccharide deacetylase family protein [Deltaproteobacteria bacterium]MBW2119284.1 divergent polysaccharide deacetylase family protein [Deltaproteobacteria bacterium]MBW2343792.1 divergent polysaccharide deacetylase family protein [Deltaproteobacteria bacterium]